MRLLCFSLILACNGRCGRDDDTCEAADTRAWYTDEDGDGFGVGDPIELCADSAGYTDQDGDCDDQDAGSFPDADRVCQDGVDQDCDGLPDCAPPAGNDDVADVFTTRFDGEAGSALGTAVAGLGDLSGDGLPDVGLGAPMASPWGGGQVYYSPSDTIEDANTADIYLSSRVTDEDADSIQVGAALAAADITGDGVRDLIVGASEGYSGEQGSSTFILPGPVAPEVVVNTDTSAIVLVYAAGDAYLTDMDYFGTEDIDLITGAAYIQLFVGPITEGGEADDLREGGLYGSTYAHGSLGESLALSDFNADGKPDLLAGAPLVEQDLPGSEVLGDLGGAFVFNSTGDFRDDTSSSFFCCDDLAIYGYTDGALLGAAVAYAGDPDGDGYDDLYIGAPGALDPDGKATGAVYYFDGATLAALDRGTEIYADSATLAAYGADGGDEFGASLLTGLNIDGANTLVIGAPGHDDEEGAVALWYQRPEDGDTLYDADYRLSGTAAGDRFGAALANAGDTNALGWDDLLIGAPGSSDGDGAGWLMVFDQL